jgi:SHS2 domain-containing protein
MAGTRSSTGRSSADALRAAEHELLAHTAEVRLRVRAPDFPALAAEAGRALAALELGGEPPPAAGDAREVVLRAADQGALLVDWLNELIYLAETERWVATEFLPQPGGALELRMRARGATVDIAPSRVKAATHHGLEVRTTPGGVEAEVVFDV